MRRDRSHELRALGSESPTDPFGADAACVPPLRLTLGELRTGYELGATLAARPVMRQWPLGDGRPVLVLPGFLGSSQSTLYLRWFLRRQGYYAHDWRLGPNLGVRDGLADALGARLHEVYAKHQQPVSLIGWSAGGIYACELARQHPEMVRTVITLGSPIRGNLRASRAWVMFRLLSGRERLAARVTADACKVREQPLSVPSVHIYSRSDGIVSWRCCAGIPGSLVENVEVSGSHLGYGHNLEVLHVIAHRLTRPVTNQQADCIAVGIPNQEYS